MVDIDLYFPFEAIQRFIKMFFKFFATLWVLIFFFNLTDWGIQQFKWLCRCIKIIEKSLQLWDIKLSILGSSLWLK